MFSVPSPVPTPSPSTDVQTVDVRAACLNSHNKVRRLHQNTPDMIYDTNLELAAQEWARRLATEKAFYHGSTGENLFYVTNYDTSVNHRVEEAVFAWYNERLDYDYTNGVSSNGRAVGHFTQIVWRDTTRLGCGMATILRLDANNILTKETYVVARYTPAGNFVGEYTTMVARPYVGANLPNSWDDLL